MQTCRLQTKLVKILVILVMLLLNPLFCMTAINTYKAIYERELRFFGYYTTVYTLVNKVVTRSR